MWDKGQWVTYSAQLRTKKKMCDFRGKSTADQAALTSYDNYTSAPTNLLHVLKSAFQLAVMIAAILFHINVGR